MGPKMGEEWKRTWKVLLSVLGLELREKNGEMERTWKVYLYIEHDGMEHTRETTTKGLGLGG